MTIIDRFLNNITMYRLVLYALGILSVLAILFSILGLVSNPVPAMLISLALFLGVSFFADLILSRVTRRMSFNPESSLITALILFLIIAPPASVADGLWIVAAALIAIGSKYLFSFKRKHIFNPAAFAALALTVLGAGMATWWVATPALFPAILVLGLFIVRKLRRFDFWLTFMVVAFVTKVIAGVVTGGGADLIQWFVSWPTLFFSTIMLTEPLTMPATGTMRRVYTVLTAILFSIPFAFGAIHSTPQLALIIGNIFTFLVSPKGRTRLRLVRSERQSSSIVEFVFKPDRPLKFTAGQYAEWTLPHSGADDRGVRRYFTFASAPDDPEVRLAVRVGTDMSTFKETLTALPVRGMLSISNIAGDFTLPDDLAQKLIFVAGGVGITPFISMIRQLQLRGGRRDIVLLYLANAPEDFAYNDELSAATNLGVRTLYVPSSPSSGWKGKTGSVSRAELARFVPDIRERAAYVSGPDGMVAHYKTVLKGQAADVKTDYFPGL